MLYHLLYSYSIDYNSAFNVFKYITFRTVCSILTSMFLAFLIGPQFIERLTKKQIGQIVRSDGPLTHLTKTGTPTMGGIWILICVVLSSLLWARLDNHYVWIVLFVACASGLVGFLDDYKKLKTKKGISAKKKMVLLITTALLASVYLYFIGFSTELELPFFKNIRPELGIGFILFSTLVIIATSNSVNLTDGLDGLAIGPVITSSIALLVLSYITGHIKISEYLGISFIDGAGELAIICGSIIGAGIGFLWYNTYPAQVFMGDVGSLSLGSAIGIIAVITKNELLLFLIGGVFVIEALSVIIQVGFFKISGGKRILHMAPLHHHFELKGWAEPKIIVRFWIISIILALFALGTLKLR